MFIIENGKITGEKTLDIGKSRIINLVFKSGLQFADDDKFKLVLGSIQSENYAFVDDGCLRFSYVDVADVIKSQSANFSIQILHNGVQILADSITITAVIQGGGSSDVQGIIFNNTTKLSTEVKVIPSDLTKDWTDFSYMFHYCISLTSIPQIDTSKGTNFNRMFAECGLTTIPQLDTSNGTDFSYMFSTCSALTSIPLIDTSNGTYFNYMFTNCTALTSIPQLDTSKGRDFSNMFDGCSAVKTIPQIDVSGNRDYYASITYILRGCRALENFGGLLNAAKSFNISTCTALTHQSLLNILNGLYDLTGSTSQKLTLGSTNLAKLTDEEKAIATNKNWTLA